MKIFTTVLCALATLAVSVKADHCPGLAIGGLCNDGTPCTQRGNSLEFCDCLNCTPERAGLCCEIETVSMAGCERVGGQCSSPFRMQVGQCRCSVSQNDIDSLGDYCTGLGEGDRCADGTVCIWDGDFCTCDCSPGYGGKCCQLVTRTAVDCEACGGQCNFPPNVHEGECQCGVTPDMYQSCDCGSDSASTEEESDSDKVEIKR